MPAPRLRKRTSNSCGFSELSLPESSCGLIKHNTWAALVLGVMSLSFGNQAHNKTRSAEQKIPLPLLVVLARHSEKGEKTSRQRKRWEDNIREWTGLEFGKSQRAVENGGKWRKLVAKLSVVPQRPSRLRD